MIKTTNRWRCADKPFEISFEELRRIEQDERGEYIATMKLDGYRTLVDFTNKNPIAFSRKETPSIHPVNKSLEEAMLQFMEENNLPEGSRIDGEWCARRKGARSGLSSLSPGQEQIVIFGVFYLGKEWLGDTAEGERWNLVKNWKYNDKVILAESTEVDYVDLFKKSKEDWKYEGIVLKDRSSFLIGDPDSCKQNPLWLKVRWRGNDDGLTILEE